MVLQAAFVECQFLDFLPFSENGFSPVEVDVGWCHIVPALVVAVIVVVFDKCFDLPLQIAGQKIMLQQNPVLHGLMPALYLA